MPISTKNFHEYINSCQSNTNRSLENTQLTGAICALNKGSVYSVPTINDLPPASDNEGRLIFVTEIGAYRYSDGFEWTNDYDTTPSENTLYAWGNGFRGPLGDGTTINRSSPVQEVSSSTDWCQVSAGGYHSLALKCEGSLWGWGFNNVGQLGDGVTLVDRSSPVQEITSSTDWCQFSASFQHSLALKKDGTLWGFGSNSCYRLGYCLSSGAFCSPVQESTSSTDWCQISGGTDHSLGLKTSGTLWSWGRNDAGQLGDGFLTGCSRCATQEITSSVNWCQISAGNKSSFALKNDGTMWVWGNNINGKLGDGTTNICYSSPVQEVTLSTDWFQVSSGCEHTIALKTSGTAWGWGQNFFGTLSDGTQICRSSPVQEITSSTDWSQVSGAKQHTSALKKDGTLWGWGLNNAGQLGGGTTNICYSSPVQEVSSNTSWICVSNNTFGGFSLAFKYERGFL